jgi:hypothetical protein
MNYNLNKLRRIMATQSKEETTAEAPINFEKRVNDIVSQMTQDDKGAWQLPSVEMSEELKYAANSERRRRTTESSYGKLKKELLTQKTLATKLAEQIKPATQLTAEEKEALDELKYSDPDAWREQMNQRERDASKTLTTSLESLNADAAAQAEIALREDLLAEYNRKNPSNPLTDDVINNDVPPRLTAQLASGEITFSEFLSSANKYLNTGKSVAASVPTSTPNLNNVGGSSTPSTNAVKEDLSTTYKNFYI